MKRLAFQQVDVFTATPFQGNPVAVVLEGDSVPEPLMQAIAGWTNLSETTFVCSPTRPEADYRLRIFTPRGELPFAGHPTVGSAYAALRHGLQPRTPGRLIQECGRGLVSLRLEEDRLFFELPASAQQEPSAEQLAAAAEALGIGRGDVLRASVIDVGPVWFTLQLADAGRVLALRPDFAKVAALGPAGLAGVTVCGLYPASSPAQVEVRSFAPAHGVAEDPVCGSGNGCVATLLRRDPSRPEHYVASQGQCVGRKGRVYVRYEGAGTWVGGEAVTCIEGTLLVSE
jgi:PhzF family phenazine biosynthesis protein